MNTDQIKLLEETLRSENAKVPVAFIADSPWIPGYCGHTFIDYYARTDVWMADPKSDGLMLLLLNQMKHFFHNDNTSDSRDDPSVRRRQRQSPWAPGQHRRRAPDGSQARVHRRSHLRRPRFQRNAIAWNKTKRGSKFCCLFVGKI